MSWSLKECRERIALAVRAIEVGNVKDLGVAVQHSLGDVEQLLALVDKQAALIARAYRVAKDPDEFELSEQFIADVDELLAEMS